MNKTADGKVILWNKKTGQRVERHSIDARAMIDSGEFSETEVGNAVNTPENPNAAPPVKATKSGIPVAPAPVRAAAPTPAKPAAPFDTGLPKTTPLGEPAVHSTKADATPAKTGPTVTRVPAKKRK